MIVILCPNCYSSEIELDRKEIKKEEDSFKCKTCGEEFTLKESSFIKITKS